MMIMVMEEYKKWTHPLPFWTLSDSLDVSNLYFSLGILKRRQISAVYLGDDNGLCNGPPPSLPAWSAIRCCRKLTRDWKKRSHCSHLNFPSDTSWWFARLKWYFSPQRDLKSWSQPCTGHIIVPLCASCSFSSAKFTLIGRSSESAASDITRTGQSKNVWEQKELLEIISAVQVISATEYVLNYSTREWWEVTSPWHPSTSTN